MKKFIFGSTLTFMICIFAGCSTIPVNDVREMPDMEVESSSWETEFDEPVATVTPVPTDTPKTTATLAPTATPKSIVTPKLTVTSRPTKVAVVDRNVVERDAYAVNGKNGKIHKTGDCPATGDGKNAMTTPVYFPTYEEAEAYSMKIKRSLDKRRCGNCWR